MELSRTGEIGLRPVREGLGRRGVTWQGKVKFGVMTQPPGKNGKLQILSEEVGHRY